MAFDQTQIADKLNTKCDSKKEKERNLNGNVIINRFFN